MGFRERIRQVAEGTVDIFAAPVGLMVDTARAITSDQYNPGFFGVFGPSAERLLTGVGKISEGTGLADVGRGLGESRVGPALKSFLDESYAIYNTEFQQQRGQGVFGLDPGQFSIQRGLGTFTGAAASLPGMLRGGDPSDVVNLYRQWQLSEHRTAGQAWVEQALFPDFYQRTPGEQDEIRAGVTYNLLSGGIDAGAIWMTDPLVMAGKSIRVARRRFFTFRMDDFGQVQRHPDQIKAIRKMGYDLGPEGPPEGGLRTVTLKSGKKDEVYAVPRASVFDQLQAEGVRIPPEADAALAAFARRGRGGQASTQEVNEARAFLRRQGLDESEVDELIDAAMNLDASEALSAEFALEGLLGEGAVTDHISPRYPGTQHRPLYLMSDLDEAKRYAAALYQADPTDMPILMRVKAEGLRVVYEDFNLSMIPDPKQFDPRDATFLTMADKLTPQQVRAVERFRPRDLDPALLLDGNPPPHLEPPGRLNPRLFDADGRPIEPDRIAAVEDIANDFRIATQLANQGDGLDAQRYLLGKQMERNQSLVVGDSFGERAANHKVVQNVLNWIDNNGRGRSMEEMRRKLFSNTPFGDVISYWLTEVNTYDQRKAILLASMGFRTPQLDTVQPLLRARVEAVLRDADRIKAGHPPDEMLRTLAGGRTRFKDVAPEKVDDVVEELLGELRDRTRLDQFLDGISERAPIRQLRMPSIPARMTNAIRKTSFFQESPGARPIRSVTEWRPRQWLNVEDTFADRQLARQLQEAAPLGFTETDINRYLRLYTEATNEHAKVRVVTQMNEDILKRAADVAGMSPDQFNEALRVSRAGSTRAQQYLESRRYASGGRDRRRWLDDETGEIIEATLPVLTTQLQNFVPMPNVRSINKVAKRMGELTRRGHDIPQEMIDLFYRVWKPSVLLRGGWMLRVIADEQLRILAYSGSLLTHISAMSRIPKDKTPRFTRLFDKGAPKPGQYAPGQVAGKKVAAALGTVTLTQPTVAASVRASRLIAKTTEKLKLVDQDVLRHMDNVGLEDLVRARAGHGGPQEDVMRSLQALMGRDELTIYDHLRNRGTGQWRSVTAGDPQYASAWGRVLTEQYGRDPFGRFIIQQILETGGPSRGYLTEAEFARVVDRAQKYLRHTPEGREVAQRMQWFRGKDGYEEWAEILLEELADYTGGYNEDLLRGSLKQKVTREMMEGIDEALRPDAVHAEVVAQSLGNSVVTEFVNSFIAEGFDIMGSLPTDTLSRQPFFKQLYAKEMVRMERARAMQGLPLDDSAIKSMNQSARQFAIRQVREMMYDLGEVTRFGHMMRMLVPFYPAWQEIFKVWTRLAIEDPSVLRRAMIIWEGPNKLGIVETDDDGEEWLVFRLGEESADKLELTGWKRYLAEGGMRFGKTSFNLVLNNPLPGVGPHIQLPINEIVKKKPELEESLRWLLPFGVSVNSSDILMSPLIRQFRGELTGPQSDRSYTRAFADALTWMDVEYRAGRRMAPVSLDEAHDVARGLWVVRLITRLTAPAQPIFDSPLQPYIDIYRDMIDNLGPDEADEAFLNEYGNEFIAVTISRTMSHTGIPPTVEGEQARKHFEELIQKYPEYGRLIVGDSALGEFTTGAFAAQLERPIDPDNPFSEMERVYRPTEIDPRTGRVIEADRRLGWQEYIKAMDWLDLQRKQRGLPNLLVSEAQDLAQVRQLTIQHLATQYPSWWDDFNTRDNLKWTNRIDAFREITKDPTLIEHRPDIQGLATYLELRQAIIQELNRRKMLGGASTLQATSNQDLAEVWETVIFMLLEDNIAFGPLYYRYLEGDTLELRSGD